MTGQFETIERYLNLTEAQAARMFLESRGFHVFLADVETVNMDWLLGNAIGYVKLQVPGDEVEAARAALANHSAMSVNEAGASDQTSETADESANEPDLTDEEIGDPTPVTSTLRLLFKPFVVILLAPLGAAIILGVLYAAATLVRHFAGLDQG